MAYLFGNPILTEVMDNAIQPGLEGGTPLKLVKLIEVSQFIFLHLKNRWVYMDV